jgi:CxxC motif-containing protein
MKTRELICVLCPNGCSVRVDIEEGSPSCIRNMEGCQCEKGLEWAEQEICNPVRTITSSILVEDGEMPLVSVRTDVAVPLEKILAVMEEIRGKIVRAPIESGDLLICNPAGVCCNLVATRAVPRLEQPEADSSEQGK